MAVWGRGAAYYGAANAMCGWSKRVWYVTCTKGSGMGLWQQQSDLILALLFPVKSAGAVSRIWTCSCPPPPNCVSETSLCYDCAWKWLFPWMCLDGYVCAGRWGWKAPHCTLCVCVHARLNSYSSVELRFEFDPFSSVNAKHGCCCACKRSACHCEGSLPLLRLRGFKLFAYLFWGALA